MKHSICANLKVVLLLMFLTATSACNAEVGYLYVVPLLSLPLLICGFIFFIVSFFRPVVSIVFSILILALQASMFLWSDIHYFMQRYEWWFIVSVLINVSAILLSIYLLAKKTNPLIKN